MLAALEHEYAHALAAKRVGFCLNKITLMPYGAVVSGDIAGISPKQEAFVCVAGPLANALTALLFVAIWWLFPESYPYTDRAAALSFSLFLVNLFPAYPLDGGRLFLIVLRPLGAKKAKLICKILSLCIAGGLLCYFVGTCFFTPSWNTLFFALCIAGGCVGGDSYQRLNFSRQKSFTRGVEERRIAISSQNTFASVLRFLKEDRYLVLLLFSNEEFVCEVTEEEFLKRLEGVDLTCTLGEVFV